MIKKIISYLTILLLFIVPSCSKNDSEITLNAGGATFPNPLYQKWILEYQKQNPITINYNSQGSGFGIKGITDKTLHFAGSDAPLSNDDIKQLGGEDKVIEFPTCAGGVVPIFNLPGINTVNFSGEVLADIYLGKIIFWDDGRIKELNPNTNLPHLTILVAYRAEGSGTTNIFTTYLSLQSSEFLEKVGSGKQVKFPIGQGGKGSDGVVQIIQSTPGAIGYAEHNYAISNKVSYGAVRNKSGKFIKATVSNISLAADSAAPKLNGHLLKASILDQTAEDVYPIASFTYQIVYVDLNNLPNKQTAKALISFLKWEIHEGQKFNTDLDYAPLTPAIQSKIDVVLDELTYKGEKI